MLRPVRSRLFRIASTTISKTPIPIVSSVPVSSAANGKTDKPIPPSVRNNRKNILIKFGKFISSKNEKELWKTDAWPTPNERGKAFWAQRNHFRFVVAFVRSYRDGEQMQVKICVSDNWIQKITKHAICPLDILSLNTQRIFFTWHFSLLRVILF